MCRCVYMLTHLALKCRTCTFTGSELCESRGDGDEWVVNTSLGRSTTYFGGLMVGSTPTYMNLARVVPPWGGDPKSAFTFLPYPVVNK